MAEHCEEQVMAATRTDQAEYCENEVVPGECFCECHLPVQWCD